MSFNNALFYSQVPEKLQGSHKLLESYIKQYVELAEKEAEMLRIYRKKRTLCIKEALKDGYGATVASDIAKGGCAIEKENYVKALAVKQQCRYNIQAVQDRIYTIRHISSQIEHQMKV
jgi:hypothetical protein